MSRERYKFSLDSVFKRYFTCYDNEDDDNATEEAIAATIRQEDVYLQDRKVNPDYKRHIFVQSLS